MTNFWEQLESKQISNKETAEKYLLTKLGSPTTEIQQNLLQEFCKKVHAYYFQAEIQNTTTFSLYGFVQEIQEKKFKEGKRMGQVYYLLKLGEPKGEKIKATKEDLPTNKWQQIEKLAILGKNLVFKYKKWITNKELLDFNSQPKKNQVLTSAKLEIKSGKAETG